MQERTAIVFVVLWTLAFTTWCHAREYQINPETGRRTCADIFDEEANPENTGNPGGDEWIHEEVVGLANDCRSGKKTD